MILTPEIKYAIDAKSYYDLLRGWRFGLAGELMQGESGKYWALRMTVLKSENPEQAVQDSKLIGWG